MTLFAAASGRAASLKNRALYAPLLSYIALTFLVAATGFYTFQQVENVIEAGEIHDLGAIADAKVGQITAWRDNQLRIGEALFRDSSLASEFDQWQREGMPTNVHKQNLTQLLTELHDTNEDKTFLLVDKQGVVRISVNDKHVLQAHEGKLALQAMENGKVQFSDFHRNGSEDKGISIDLAVPLTVGDKKRVVGAMLLQIDPYKFFYPLIQSGTEHGSSVETLLMRRDGNEVVLLNELRRGVNSALFLRVPLSATNRIAAMAVRGETGTADGVDFYGVPVIAALRAVPGSSWFMATKIDKDELFAPINRLKTWTAYLGVMFVAFVGGLLFFWLRGIRTQQKLLISQRDAAVERERLVKHFEYLSKYASDIILVADEGGRIVDANERALEAYGYTREELLRMRIVDLRLPTEDSAVIHDQFEQIKAKSELRYETINHRKDGTTFPVEVSMRLIEVQGTKYLQGIGRDITERKRIEDTLRKSEALLKDSQRMAQIGSWEMDLVSNELTWTDESYRVFEIDPKQFGASYEAFLNTVHPDDRDMVNKVYTDSVKNRTPYDIVHRLQLPDQRVKYIREWCETYYDSDGRPLRSIGTSKDVTERVLNERRILRLNNFYAAISRANEAIVQISDRDRLFNEICSIAIKYGQFKLAWIGLVDDETQAVKVAAFSGEASGYLEGINVSIDADKPDGRGPTGTTIRDNKEAIFNNFFNDPGSELWHENAKKYGLMSSAACPLLLEGKVVGALTLYAGEVNYFDEDLANLLSDLSRDISIALNNFAREEQRKQAEEMLRQSEEMQRRSAEEIQDLYDNAPCGYHSLDRDGIIVRINNTELNWLGYTREDVIEKMNFADLLTLNSQRKFQRSFPKFKEQGNVIELEYELIRKDGSVFPVILNATAVFDAEGQYVMSRSTLHDITERKFAQEALQESELLFRTMVDNAPMIIWVADANRGHDYQGCNFFNRKWHEFTRHTLDETQGYNWMFYVHPDDRDHCLDAYEDAFRQAKPFKQEYRLLRHDGVYRWMEDSGVPRFTEAGKFLGHIGTCVDITEQKQFEEMRAQMEHVGRLNIAGEMASGIAHELSQPLTACNNYLDGCLRRMDGEDWDREKLRKAVQLASKQAGRAGNIINHLKGLVRKQGNEHVLIDINALIDDVLSFLEDEIWHNGISVSMELSDLPQVMASKVEIEQVFLNLCKNAIEAMSSCPQRELFISSCITESGHVRVAVKDSGTGFMSADAESLFNPFHTSKKDGLGLGLAICRSFIENHGGRIWAEQQLDLGAEFCFTLPVGGVKEHA